MSYWLAVVHRDHVRRGVAGGFAQTHHGARGGIAEMSAGDGLVFYSPKDIHPGGVPLRAFTAIGRVAPGEIWQEDLGDFRPWRRSVDFASGTREVPIAPLLTILDLTRETPNWGWLMRRGQLELSRHDFGVLATELGADNLVP
jgi:hypothetical protein